MKVWLVIISVGLIVFLAGCVKEKPTEVQFKNDVITIENYVVDNVAPYASTDSTTNKVTISFDIKNNGDKPVKWAKVNFFDTPGFEVIATCLPLAGYTLKSAKEEICVCVDDTRCKKDSEVPFSLECRKFGGLISDSVDERSCTFGDLAEEPTTLDVIDPLDTRSVKFILRTPKNINSPTPFTVSFSVTYRYGSVQQANTYFFSGERTAIIPVIDPDFKKEPSSKFSQSNPTIGPIVFDIIPSLEREKVVDGKTIKEYWGVVDRTFQTKFVMKKIVSEGTLKDIHADTYTPTNRPTVDCKNKFGSVLVGKDSCIELQLTNLQVATEKCNFVKVGNKESFIINEIIVNEKNNTLVCSFTPTSQSGFTSEFTGIITIQYNYDYEIVRKQNFVVYPAIS